MPITPNNFPLDIVTIEELGNHWNACWNRFGVLGLQGERLNRLSYLNSINGMQIGLPHIRRLYTVQIRQVYRNSIEAIQELHEQLNPSHKEFIKSYFSLHTGKNNLMQEIRSEVYLTLLEIVAETDMNWVPTPEALARVNLLDFKVNFSRNFSRRFERIIRDVEYTRGTGGPKVFIGPTARLELIQKQINPNLSTSISVDFAQRFPWNSRVMQIQYSTVFGSLNVHYKNNLVEIDTSVTKSQNLYSNPRLVPISNNKSSAQVAAMYDGLKLEYIFPDLTELNFSKVAISTEIDDFTIGTQLQHVPNRSKLILDTIFIKYKKNADMIISNSSITLSCKGPSFLNNQIVTQFQLRMNRNPGIYQPHLTPIVFVPIHLELSSSNTFCGFKNLVTRKAFHSESITVQSAEVITAPSEVTSEIYMDQNERQLHDMSSQSIIAVNPNQSSSKGATGDISSKGLINPVSGINATSLLISGFFLAGASLCGYIFYSFTNGKK